MELHLPLLLLPVAINAAGGAALHTGGKSPPFQSRWMGPTWLFLYFICLCNRGMGRMVLMKDVNNWHSVLLTVSMHIFRPCTFWVYFTSFYYAAFYSQLLILQELQLYFNSGCQRYYVWMRCDTSRLVFLLSLDSLAVWWSICLRIKWIHFDLFSVLSSEKQQMKRSTLWWT